MLFNISCAGNSEIVSLCRNCLLALFLLVFLFLKFKIFSASQKCHDFKAYWYKQHNKEDNFLFM